MVSITLDNFVYFCARSVGLNIPKYGSPEIKLSKSYSPCIDSMHTVGVSTVN